MSYFDLFPQYVMLYYWCIDFSTLSSYIYYYFFFFFDEEKQKILMIEDQLVWGFMEMIY